MEKIRISILLVICLPLTAFANPADQIMKEVEKHARAKDESATVNMTIVEPNGGKKERELKILRKSDKKQKVLLKITSPADLRGTAFLSIGESGKSEDQWLYLPSQKQTRRILSGGRGSGFLGSEVSYEDLGSSSDKQFANKILRTEKGQSGPSTVVESTITQGNSVYSKINTWVSTQNHFVEKIEYYDTHGALLKITELSNYKIFPGKVWRAGKVAVRNVQNGRCTTLEFRDLGVNSGIPDSAFSENALSNE